MTRITDFEFNIAMKIAANRCLSADVREFTALDTENTAVDPHVEKRVVRKLKFDEWKNIRRVSAVTLKYAAIALATAVSLVFGAAMTIQPVRAAFIGAIVTWYEDYIDVRYEDDNPEISDADDFVAAKPGYLPDGWSITSEHSDDLFYSCDITNSDSGFIHFSQTTDLENGVAIDSEVTDEEIVFLKGDTIEADLFINENGDYTIIWKDKCMFVLTGTNVSLDELIKIADSIE